MKRYTKCLVCKKKLDNTKSEYQASHMYRSVFQMDITPKVVIIPYPLSLWSLIYKISDNSLFTQLPISSLNNNNKRQVLTDRDLLSHLQAASSQEQDIALRAMYQQYYSMIEQLVVKNSGREEDAADIFQDGLVVLFHKVRQHDFALTASLKTLLYAICRNLWLMKLRKRKREAPLTEVHEHTISLEADALDILDKNDRNQLIAQGLKTLGGDCRQVLQLYYFEGQRMKGIAENMGYASEQVAKNKKSRCMRKLREWVLEQPQAAEMISI